MKRKVPRAGKLRLSPNEEAMFLKEEYERRRKLRLQQVREQQKHFALRIRQEVKRRREEQLHQLEEALRAEWEKEQDQKMKALERLYLSSLRAVGEGHRQARENEPDLEALAKQAEERKQRAEKRHRKALKEQKYQKEKLLHEQSRRINARKHALEVEKERAARVASLPPPPAHPLENFEVKKIPTVKIYNADNFHVTHYHLSEPYVDRELDREQVDARLVAEEEGKRLEELHREEERDRREQLEKAHLRGSCALKKVHLAQDRQRLLKELEQMQSMDRLRRRQLVAQMPRQLFVPAYKRLEIKEDWQRELEFAFEDMYSEDRKMQGDLILHFEPQPLPSPSERSQDNELDITLEHESAYDTGQELRETIEEVPDETENDEGKIHQPESKLALKKLLNKIRSQKEEWTSKSERECQNEMETIESGTIASEERQLCDLELNHEQRKNSASANKDSVEILEDAVVAENSVLTHPQEKAAKNRMEEERKKWNEQIEQQKQEQLALLKQIEEKRACLEADLLKIQMDWCLEEAKEKAKEEEGHVVQSSQSPLTDQQKEGEDETEITTVLKTASPRQASHLQMIRSYQQRLLQQNRLHKQTVEEARKCLQEYQNKLRQKYPSIPVTPLGSVEAKSISLKSALEPILQKQEGHPIQHQLSEQICTQENGWLFPGNSEIPQALTKASSQKYKEQMHDVCPGRRVRFLETSKGNQGVCPLPSSSPSQEQVEILDSSNIQVRDSSRFWTPSELGTALQGDPAVGMQPEAHIQEVRFVLPAENSSEPSGIFDGDKELSSGKMSNLLTEAEVVEERLFTVPLLSAAETPEVAQAVPSDSQESEQAPAESSIKISFEQPPSFFQPLTSSHEELKAQEFLISKSGDASLLNYSSILNLRDRVLASSESIQAQQKYLKKLQEQLDAQREALISRQKIQEQLLIRKQDKLKEQMQRQQEALKEFLNKQVRQFSTNEEMTQAKPNSLTDFFQASENDQVEDCETKQPEMLECKEQKWRSSKPPLAKVKLGLHLDQHELSVIPEVDTPRGCSFSFPDKTDSARGESPPILPVGESAYASCYSHDLHEDGRLPRSITSCEEQTSGGSPRKSEHSACPQGSRVTQDLPVPAAETGTGGVSPSGPSFRHHNMGLLSKILSTSLSSEAFMEGGPCDSSSTISTGSFLTSEILDASPADTGLSSGSTEDQILRESASHPWNSLLPFNMQWRREIFSGTSGDLEASSDNVPFQVPVAEFDFPEMERHVASFLHQHFQPLEPSLDLDVSSPLSQYNIPQDSREFSKTSGFSRKSEDTTVCVEARGSSLNTHRSGFPSHLETSNLGNTASEQESAKQNVTLGSEESFRPLQLECTESDGCQGADQPAALHVPEQNPMIINQETETWVSPARQYEELARNIESLNLQCSVEDLRNESPNSLQEPRSFYQLNTTPVAMDKTLPQQFLKEETTFEKETLCSEETPAEVVFEEYVKLAEKLVHGNEGSKATEAGSQWNTNKKKTDQAFPEVQRSSGHPVALNLETSDFNLQAVVQQNDSFLERYKKNSNAVLGGSGRIPVWETESGRGIMEEPELTLISSNDISIAESDAEHTSQEKAKDNKISNPVCADQSELNIFTEEREFLPLAPVADYSVLKRSEGSFRTQSPNESEFPSHQTAAMSLEFASVPGTLQESFLKRKKDFIQKSLRRVEEIKSKERKNATAEAGPSQRRKTEMLSRWKEAPRTSEKGAATTQLKKVGEVKVSSPEDRKAAAVEMHQRTSRLYNQLTEVKIRKEERTRQETYAKNREKAKEFQKKTLEKLRARKKPFK